jgi:hypothetical protein
MKRALAGFLGCALAAAVGACASVGVALRYEPSRESPTIVRLRLPAGMAAGNVSLGHMGWLTTPAERDAGALLVRDGDLLFLKPQEKDAAEQEQFVLPWRTEDGANVSLGVDGPCLSLADRVVSLYLGTDTAGWDWVRESSEKALAGLRFVIVDKRFAGEPLSDEQLRVFEKIAGVNPHVGLALLDGALLARVSSLDPRWLWIDNTISQADLDSLPERNAIESLVIRVRSENLNLRRLATMPNLSRLSLRDYDSATTTMPVLPHLESLTFDGGSLQDLTLIGSFTGLKELYLESAEIVSLNGIKALLQLEELAITGVKDKETLNCAALDGLKQLRWMSFGQGITPGQFARVILTHPELQTVELLDCEGITNLAALANLRKLRHLIFLPKSCGGSLESLVGTLEQMKNLRLLILREEMFKQRPADVAELRGALPDCVVAEGARRWVWN